MQRLLSRKSRLVLLLVGLVVVAVVPGRADNTGLDELSAEYYQGLRERRLFRLAESYCLERLSRGRLSDASRVDLTIELSRTLTEHAAYAAEPEQSGLWQQASDVVRDLLTRAPNGPRRILLEVQRALVPAASGEWRRWLAELQPDDPAAAERAAADLNEALTRLRELDEKISAQVRKGLAVRVPPGGLHPTEWRSLGMRVRQRQALALLDLAHVLPDKSPERMGRLLEAQKLLKPLADVADEDEFVWSNRIALVECLRLMGESARAARDIQTLEKRDPPREMADRLQCERVRLLLSEGKREEAIALLDERETRRDPVPGELAFLRVLLAAAMVRAAGSEAGSAEANARFDLLERQVERLRREVGGYWSLRGDVVLEQVRSDRLYGPALAPLVRKGEGEFQRGRLSDASTWFGKAAAAARSAGRGELAFQLGFRRASIEIEAQRWSEASAHLLELAKAFPDHPKAPQAHLLAAYCLGREYDQDPAKPHPAEYIRLLEEHRGRFSEPGTFGEATWLLATVQQRRGQTTAALKLFREIPWDHPRGNAALAAAARCYETILDRLREKQQPTEAPEREAIAMLHTALPSAADPSLTLDRDQLETAVRFARILLRRRPPDYAVADRWLVKVLAVTEFAKAPAEAGAKLENPAETSPAAMPPSDLRTQALQLRIVSLAGQGRFSEARGQLAQFSTGSPAELLHVLEGLAPLAASDRQDPFRDLGDLQLQAALRLAEQRESLGPDDRRRLDECLARGYAVTGQIRRGIQLYESLLKDTPDDKRLLTAWADLLMKCGDKPCLEQAQAAWRKLEALAPAGSEEWLEARWQVCQCLITRGESAEGCKLLKVTRLLYPKLGGEKLTAKFAELEQGCRRGTK